MSAIFLIILSASYKEVCDMKIKSTITDWQVRIRLWAAIIMACYVVSHTINFGLGIFSISVMEAYQKYALLFWRSVPVYWIVLTAIALHVTLGLWKVFKRNTFKMPVWEIAQIILGICIPFFLLSHITYTKFANLLFSTKDNYTYVLMLSFPGYAWEYVAMIAIVWAHAQIGVHAVLRMQPWYTKIRPLIFIVFCIMPVIGVTGYLMSGMEIFELSKSASWIVQQKEFINWPDQAQLDSLQAVKYIYYILLPGLVLIILFARAIRIKLMNKNKNISVDYNTGQKIYTFLHTTILETSRIGKVPHASICGGRGRCTTCRVRIDKGLRNLSGLGEREFKALKKIGAELNIRLACQAECNQDITITRLLPPEVKADIARRENEYTVGKDVNMVVLFADLRGFTSFAEDKFPYDVVFMLNNYFSSMGKVIEENGGRIDKFIGDGIMALFGFKTDMKKACTQALSAAKQMAVQLIEINKKLVNALSEPLEIGIGIHVGEVILGEFGYKESSKLTVIGDIVNTASRLESLNKKAKSQLIFSKDVGDCTEINFSRIKKYHTNIRGKKQGLEVLVVYNIIKELSEYV